MNALTLIIIVASIIILMVGVGIMSALDRIGKRIGAIEQGLTYLAGLSHDGGTIQLVPSPRDRFATAAMVAIISPNPDIRELLAGVKSSLAAEKITGLAYLYADWMIQRSKEGKP